MINIRKLTTELCESSDLSDMGRLQADLKSILYARPWPDTAKESINMCIPVILMCVIASSTAEERYKR